MLRYIWGMRAQIGWASSPFSFRAWCVSITFKCDYKVVELVLSVKKTLCAFFLLGVFGMPSSSHSRRLHVTLLGATWGSWGNKIIQSLKSLSNYLNIQ